MHIHSLRRSSQGMRIIPEGSSKNEASATLHKSQKEHFFFMPHHKGECNWPKCIELEPLRAKQQNVFVRSNISFFHFLIVPLLILRLLFNGQHIPVLLMPLVIGAPSCRLLLFLLEEGLPTHNFKPFYYCVLTVIRAHNSKYPEGIYAFCCP